MDGEILHVTPRTLVYPCKEADLFFPSFAVAAHRAAVASTDVSVCTCILRLENRHPSHLVAYKVKTTAVKRYVVRPNLGILLPGRTVEVAVLLNYDRARAEGVDLAAVHDRFQVCGVPVEEGVSTEALLELWQRTPEERISKTMVKCKFVSPSLVKTVTPHRTLEGATTGNIATTASPEPDLEQAKQTFKQEMAASKAKKELKALRDERDALQKQLTERNERVAALEREVAQLRAGGPEGAKGAPSSSSSPLKSLLRWIVFVLLYCIIMALMAVGVWKVMGIDVVQRINPDWSMEQWQQTLLGDGGSSGSRSGGGGGGHATK